MDQIIFNEDQVESFNTFQNAGVMHPFTCGNEKCRADLKASQTGLYCPHCDYTQNWAHECMLNWEWTVMDPFQRFKKPDPQ